MTPRAAARPFRIAHLSDLHLTARDDASRTEMDFLRPLRGMNEAFRGLARSAAVREADLLLVTGDVTDRGEIGAWRVFWSALETAGFSGRIAAIPGNHDTCCLAARLPKPRGTHREADLKKAASGLLLGGQPVRYPCVFSPDPRVVLFGLNSNNLGNLTVADNAVGEIGHFQLNALAELLHKHRKVPVKIVALHHSPNIPKIETAVRRGLRPMSAIQRRAHQIPRDQRRALRLLCVTQRVRLIVHGHLHQGEDRRVSGVRIIGAPASTEPLLGAAGRPEYEIFRYEISPSGGRVFVRRVRVSAGPAF